MPIRTLVFSVLALTVGTLQGADFLDKGISISGVPTMEKGTLSGTSLFKIRSAQDELQIRVIDEYAFGRAFEKSVSAQWVQMLMKADPLTIRLADLSPKLVPGAQLSSPSLERVATCFPGHGEVALGKRDETQGYFALRCISFKEGDQIRRDGNLIYEVDVFLFARNRGAIDTFLTEHRGPLYIRVEKKPVAGVEDLHNRVRGISEQFRPPE